MRGLVLAMVFLVLLCLHTAAAQSQEGSGSMAYSISIQSTYQQSAGGDKPYAGLSPEEITVHKYRGQPGEWARIYMIAKDPRGCSCEGTGATTQKIAMFLEIPSGFEVRFSTEPTIFYREAESNRMWADFSEVFSGCCCQEDSEGYYARDWFEIRPLSDVEEGTYTLKLNWIAYYTDANGMSQTNSGESEVKIRVVELVSPELKRAASDAIEDAEDAITLAEVYIKKYSQKADMYTAMLLLDQARDYLDDAKNYYYNKEFEMAKSKALKAKDLAEEAKSVAENSVKQAEELARKTQMIYTALGLTAAIVVIIVLALIYRKRKEGQQET